MTRFAELFIQLLIIVCAVAFAVETLPDLPDSYRFGLWCFECFSVIVFTIEYAVRIKAAKNKTKFIFSFFGLVDLISILPFYLSLGVDLRSLRALRLMRLVRLLKLVRYDRALRRILYAFWIAKEEFFLFFGVTIASLYFAAVGIYYCENEAQPDQFSSVFHSLWWAVVTLTTVGYGDTYPITAGGRAFTGVVLLVGLGIVSIPAGLISSALQEARKVERRGGLDVTDEED